MKSHQTGVGDLTTADIKTAPPTAHAGENHNALGELIGSFDAAISEGLFAALAETTDERLKDLVERRLLAGYGAAIGPDRTALSVTKAESPTRSEEWRGLTADERSKAVADLIEYGVGFVAPLFGVIEQLESILQSRNATAVLADAPRPANSQAEDAARWHEVLQHVGGCVAPVVGYGFHVSTLRPLPGANTLHGSVAEHFTKAIDAIRNHV
jgi:hypothetical protein